MTPAPAQSIAPRLKRRGKRQVSVEEIVDSIQNVGEDIEQIGKLVLEEKDVVKQFLATLKTMQPLTDSIAVSISALPAGMKGVAEAYVDSSGFLLLTFSDGHQEARDLNQTKNYDLIVSVACDIAPKFESLVAETEEKFNNPPVVEEPQEEPPQIQELPAPAPEPAPEPPTFEPPPVIEEKPPVTLEEPEPAPAQAEEEPSPEEPPSPVPPIMPVDEGARIAAIAEETLSYLKDLGNQVFEQSPVSMYFDDWMVNLRQVILSFESSDVIGADDTFTNECSQIFSTIEDELAKRLMTEAELEASAKTLAENKNLLGQLGAAAESREFVVRGKSALDFLINNVNHLQKELAEIEKDKASYRHPLKRRAWEKRRTDVTEKLNGAKKRLALAVQSCAAGQTKNEAGNGEFDAQTSDLAEKRKTALGFFTKEIDDLKLEIVKLEKLKAVTFNPVKKVAMEQKIWETNQRLIAAKKRLELAEQNSCAGTLGQEIIQEESEKMKEDAAGKVESLEKEIASNEKDNSLQVRKTATEALASAVKARVQRKTAPTQPETEEKAP